MRKYYLQIKPDNSISIVSSKGVPDIRPTDIVKQAEMDEKPVGDFRYDKDTNSLIFQKVVGSGIFEDDEELFESKDDTSKLPLLLE